MDVFKIYKRNGAKLQCNGEDVEVRKGDIEGQFLGQENLTFTLKSAYPIPFEVGEYVTIDGNKYTLNYVPTCKMQARKGTYGEAYVYDNIVMNWEADKLTRIKFLDYVLDDSNIHFSNLPTVYFYGDAIDLCDRIKANLDRVYPGEWTFDIADEMKQIKTDPTTTLLEKQITLTNVTCWEALTKLWDEFECLFYIQGHTISVGTQATMVEHTFKYGIGNGLKSITSETNADNDVMTRVYVYGSQKNLQYRYYNGLDCVSDSMFIDHLMLPCIREPEGCWYFKMVDGEIGYYGASSQLPYGQRYELDEVAPDDAEFRMVKKGTGKTLNIYIESLSGLKQYGIMEGVVTFENNTDTYFADLVDDENGIYPHIMDYNGLYDAEVVTDSGVYGEDGSISPATFWMEVTLPKDFNLLNCIIAGKTASISMKSGKLVAREFEFNAEKEDFDESKTHDLYKLTCNRVADNAIGLAFPNKDYNAESGDQFVLLNIKQPEVYVIDAEIRLLKAALYYIGNYDHSKRTYSPELDNIFLARNTSVASQLKAGAVFGFESADSTDGNTIGATGETYSLPIQQWKMKFGNSLIREYEVTLAETIDVKSDIVQRTVSAVSTAIKEGSIQTGVTTGTVTEIGNARYLRKDSDDDNKGHKLRVGSLEIGSYKIIDTMDGLAIVDANGNAATLRADKFFETL